MVSDAGWMHNDGCQIAVDQNPIVQVNIPKIESLRGNVRRPVFWGCSYQAVPK